jgi:hypothetical protein
MAFASKALGTALTLGALASVATTLPANAQIAACSGSYNRATVFSGSFSCQAGDKIYSNFTAPVNLPSNFGLIITDTNPFHTLSTLGTYSPGSYSFSYKVAIDTTLAPNRYISTYSTDFQFAGSPPLGTPVGTKILDATLPNVAPATAKALNGLRPSPPVFLPVGTQAVDFDWSFSIAAGQAGTGTTDTIFQEERTVSVPGPLSIVGAAAAFGFSRKLRNRIKQTV